MTIEFRSLNIAYPELTVDSEFKQIGTMVVSWNHEFMNASCQSREQSPGMLLNI